jgi:spore coat protein I
MAIDYYSLLENTYGLEIKRLTAASGGQVAECDDGRLYTFKQSRLSPEKLICTQVALEHLSEQGFTEAQPFIVGENGLPFASYGGSCYTLSPATAGRECALEDAADLAAASALLARLHRAAVGFTAARAEEALKKYEPLVQARAHRPRPVGDQPSDNADDSNDGEPSLLFQAAPASLRFKCDLGKTPETFRKRAAELRRFRKVAKKRREPFDYEYSTIADYYCNKADEICARLENSRYNVISKQYEQSGCLCHREYTSHNILMDKNSSAPKPIVVLGFDSVCIEMPIYDLANFIRRRMRKCGWSAKDGEIIVEEYDKVNTVTDDEKEILKLLLQFPQKLWRIVNKYYNSRRSWCEKNCLAKLQEVKSEKEPLSEFAENFLK